MMPPVMVQVDMRAAETLFVGSSTSHIFVEGFSVVPP